MVKVWMVELSTVSYVFSSSSLVADGRGNLELSAAAAAGSTLNVDGGHLRGRLWLLNLWSEGDRTRDSHGSGGSEARISGECKLKSLVKFSGLAAELTDSLHDKLVRVGLWLALGDVQTDDHAVNNLFAVGICEGSGLGLGLTLTLSLTLVGGFELGVFVVLNNVIVGLNKDGAGGEAEQSSSEEGKSHCTYRVDQITYL